MGEKCLTSVRIELNVFQSKADISPVILLYVCVKMDINSTTIQKQSFFALTQKEMTSEEIIDYFITTGNHALKDIIFI